MKERRTRRRSERGLSVFIKRGRQTDEINGQRQIYKKENRKNRERMKEKIVKEDEERS